MATGVVAELQTCVDGDLGEDVDSPIVAARIVNTLGILLFGLSLVAGSLVGGVALDVIGTRIQLNGLLVIGVVPTFVTAVLAAITPAHERVAR